jgi:hypothetical protein
VTHLCGRNDSEGAAEGRGFIDGDGINRMNRIGLAFREVSKRVSALVLPSGELQWMDECVFAPKRPTLLDAPGSAGASPYPWTAFPSSTLQLFNLSTRPRPFPSANPCFIPPADWRRPRR